MLSSGMVWRFVLPLCFLLSSKDHLASAILFGPSSEVSTEDGRKIDCWRLLQDAEKLYKHASRHNHKQAERDLNVTVNETFADDISACVYKELKLNFILRFCVIPREKEKAQFYNVHPDRERGSSGSNRTTVLLERATGSAVLQESGRLQANLLLSLTWTDWRLDWSDESFKSIPKIQLTENDKIWTPRLALAKRIKSNDAATTLPQIKENITCSMTVVARNGAVKCNAALTKLSWKLKLDEQQALASGQTVKKCVPIIDQSPEEADIMLTSGANYYDSNRNADPPAQTTLSGESVNIKSVVFDIAGPATLQVCTEFAKEKSL